MRIAAEGHRTATAPSRRPSEQRGHDHPRTTSTTSRADGRNTPGVDVPYGFDGAVTVTVGGRHDDARLRARAHRRRRKKRRSCSSRSAATFITSIAQRDLLRPRSGRQRGQRDRLDPDRFRQLWGFLGHEGSPFLRVSLLAAVALAGCTVQQTEAPPLTGSVRARADARRDGAARQHQPGRRIAVVDPGHRDRPGRQAADRACRCAWTWPSNGVAQDYGTLSARTRRDQRDGVATVVYTAPPSPAGGLFGTCQGLPGNCVQIVATASGTRLRRQRSPEMRDDPAGAAGRHSAACVDADRAVHVLTSRARGQCRSGVRRLGELFRAGGRARGLLTLEQCAHGVQLVLR